MALLDEVKQNGQRPQEGGRGTPTPRGGGEDDVMAAVDGAMESDEFNELGIGTELASEEEQQKMESIVDSIQSAIHGTGSDRIVELLEKNKEPYQGLGVAGHVLSLAAYMQANKQGLEPDADLFLAENGVVQTTMELLWEVAVSMGKVKNDDDQQFAAALIDAERRIGETILEEGDPEAIASAQKMMLEMETGEPVTEMMADEEAAQMVGPEGEQMPPEGPPQQGPPQQGGGQFAGLDPRQQGGIPPEVMQQGGY